MSRSAESGVYRIDDAVSGRFYIGGSVNIRKRWLDHIRRLERGDHANPALQAIWSAGKDRLSFRVVRTVERDEVIRAEQEELDRSMVGRNRMCLNVFTVAGSAIGIPRSPETRAKISAAHKGKTISASARAKMRAAKLGKKLSRDHVSKCVPPLLAGNKKRWERDRGKPCWATRVLSVEEVLRFRGRRAEGANLITLAREFGIGFGTAQRLGAGEIYKDVA